MEGNYLTGFCRIQEGKIVTHAKSSPASTEPLSEFLDEMYSKVIRDYPKFYKMDTLSKLGVLATELIVGEKDLTMYAPGEIAVVLANKHASLDTDLAFRKSIAKMASPALFVYTLPNIVTGEICIRNGWKGENAFFVQETFDMDFHTHYVDSLLETGNAKVCLAGWVDVIGEDHDVFLYLVEKVNREGSIKHSKENLFNLYTQ